MGVHSSHRSAQAFVRSAVKSKPIEDQDGKLIFKYDGGVFYLGLLFAALIVAVAFFNPPRNNLEILFGVFLFLIATYMCMESKLFYLSASGNSLTRHSPWPWHRKNEFAVSEISTINYRDSVSLFVLTAEDGRKLRASIMLNGIFRYVANLSNNSNVKLTKNAKRTIEHYS